MSYDEVVSTLSSNGQSLKIVDSYRYSSTGSKIDTAEIPGTLIYATFRVNQIKLTFANHKLIGIIFTVANDRQADAFYAKTNELFGKGLESSFEDESAKKTFSSPQPCYTSVRYRSRTYIESRAAYSWSIKQGRHHRYGFLELNDWRAKDKAFKRDHSSEAQQFEAMQQEEQINCPDCSGSGKCSACGGEGHTRDYETYPCRDCKSRGYIVVHGPGGGKKTCRFCQGTGRIRTSHKIDIECARCSGSGKCARCGGTGQIKTP